jgi:hypothetical protein
LLSCGDTFLVPTSLESIEHLWIVLTDPELGTNKAACVSITKRRPHSETTVILSRGDHPFITRESVVYYQDAKILDLGLVQRALNGEGSYWIPGS